MKHDDVQALGKALSDLSTGRQPYVCFFIIIFVNIKEVYRLFCYSQIFNTHIHPISYDSSLWEDLKHNKSPILLIVGDKDEKLKKIAQIMCSKLEEGKDDPVKRLQTIVNVPNCGHAVHIENPLHVIRSISEFVARLNVLD